MFFNSKLMHYWFSVFKILKRTQVIKSDTKYFEPSKKEFMINYRVADLEALVVELKKEGVTICDEIESFDYGKFVHIMDPDGNKIELWEPIDQVFTDSLNGKTTK